MGREARSRRHLPLGTVCYVCGQDITDGQAWNRDHVPPRRFYGKSIRNAFNPNLDWLHTHTACNSSYKKDEEYYVASFASHADSDAGRAVFEDWSRGVAKGHDTGLLKTIMGQFGKVVTADGSLVFNYDADRAGRFLWKLVRGVHFREVGRFLPENLPKRLMMLSPEKNQHAAADYPWWPLVRDTQPMGAHGAIFDYKWLCTITEGIKGNAIGMLLWDRLLVLALFHDPSCGCDHCALPRQATAGSPQAGKRSLTTVE
jgi:hypothetical protein